MQSLARKRKKGQTQHLHPQHEQVNEKTCRERNGEEATNYEETILIARELRKNEIYKLINGNRLLENSWICQKNSISIRKIHKIDLTKVLYPLSSFFLHLLF